MKEAVTRHDMPIPVLIDCLPGTGVPLELGGRGRAPMGRTEAARTPTVAKAPSDTAFRVLPQII